uniref:Uncharacterized protein n=1 Tax=Candidatus Kentrum sp. MB TaxID=2138164 RepID=A0A450Y1G9_9GAMM|nr:MAG: hypothetical protein BECKMB1821G_GA0114241_11196 [Candidatus Kentron sp. MB]VFK35355.1 MAG: hypothetical protein BECKMB1821I_GA0114274_11139 [Candidatus Kentron sp. MB]VFK77241.1 MAG: hypothetical protein BECKMB1821H_GA0114242_11139 [Candidatus Kentron sp. MB]
MKDPEKPLLCIRCGNWMNNSGRGDLFICRKCEYDNSPHMDFYRQCYEIGQMMSQDAVTWERLNYIYLDQTRSGKLRDVFALIAPFVLGFAVNATYDLAKEWIIQREKSFHEEYGKNVDVIMCTEIIGEFFKENQDRVEEIQTPVQDIKRNFPDPKKTEQSPFWLPSPSN